MQTRNESLATAQNSHNGTAELIPITEQNGRKAVSARTLHVFLESKQEFSNWIKGRIDKYGFVENVDFEVFDNFVKNPNGGRPLTEYALSINMAKEISMVEGNGKGKQARQYFIACEEKANQKPLSTLELLELTIKGMRENHQELQEVKRDVLELKARTQTSPDFFTIAGFATLNGMQVNLQFACKLGKAAKELCRRRNIQTGAIPDPRFGRVHTYPTEVLQEVFALPVNA